MPKKYVYQISTNPVVKAEDQWLPFNDKEDNFSFAFIGDFSVMTGMFNSVEKTIDAIRNSALVFMIHGLDNTSYFEMGIAIALGKKVYYVTKENHNSFDFQLPYEVKQIIPVNYEAFTRLIDGL